MKLLTDELRKQLPPLGASEHDRDPIAVVKFFTPGSGWTWFAFEFDGHDTFFGAVSGIEFELGEFSLSELEQVTAALGLRVERDLYFKPTALSKIRAHYERRFTHA